MAYVPVTAASTIYELIESARISSIVRFFRSRGALSMSKVIKLDDIDWLEIGIPESQWFFNKEKYLQQRGVLKDETNSYWLDIDVLKAFLEQAAKTNSIVLWGVFVFLGLILLIPILLIIFGG